MARALVPARKCLRAPAALMLALLLAGCSGPQNVVLPHGPAAQIVNQLWWVLLTVSGVAFLIWCGFIAWALFRRRTADAPRAINDNAVVLSAGVLVPTVVLLGLFGYSLRSMLDIEAPSNVALTIQIVGHQWWWEARYPAQNVITANELHIPVGQPVLIQLTSQDVIHSFWVPELQKKTDVFPGRTTSTWIEATDAGTYRGQCAEYCGAQHAHMAFFVVADPPATFQAWLQQQSQPAPAPAPDSSAARGQQTFERAGCIACHTIRAGSTGAGGRLGPDLTHLASRQTIAAGLLPNTRGNLGGWILNPQAIKPAALMPPQPVNAQDMADLLDYLESLK